MGTKMGDKLIGWREGKACDGMGWDGMDGVLALWIFRLIGRRKGAMVGGVYCIMLSSFSSLSSAMSIYPGLHIERYC